MSNVASNQVTVGTSPVQIDPSPVSDRRTVIVRALAANTAPVYLGIDATVTTSGPTGGLELSPKDSVTMNLDNTSPIWAITGSAGQGISIFQTDTGLG